MYTIKITTCNIPRISKIRSHSSSKSMYFFKSLSADAVLCKGCIIKNY